VTGAFAKSGRDAHMRHLIKLSAPLKQAETLYVSTNIRSASLTDFVEKPPKPILRRWLLMDHEACVATLNRR
jgi:hypothetical protein